MPLTIDTALKHMAREQEEHEAANLAAKLGLTYTLLDDYPFNLESLSLVPIRTVEALKTASYIQSASKIRFASLHPQDPAVLEMIKKIGAEQGRETEVTVVSHTSLSTLLLTYAKLLQEKAEKEAQYKLQTAENEKKNYFKKIKTLADFKTELANANTTDLIDVILAAAYNQNASDVHLEPGENDIMVRFRIDGVLRPIIEMPTTQLRPIVSRLKMMANIRLDEHNASQDGRFSLMDKGINADVRISIIPTGYGEGIVMRILRQDMQILSIAELGFSTYNQELIEKTIHKPYGLILVTGPTGSGKSTTLYSILRVLNSPERKIITLEDPIEYRIEGLQQSQINIEKGFSFADGLRGALRQDPDVVMVGEIRDAETATIALNASLTGHLVLSTLHTNNAVAVHTRLLEMGIAPFLISGSIQMIIAQRLVRKLVAGSSPENPQYKGRLVVAEVQVPTQEFEQAVLQKKDQDTLERLAEEGGMIPILKDGMDKVKASLTTEAELSRVTEVF